MFHRNKEGVSPVVGTILMIAIVTVLSASLIYYLTLMTVQVTPENIYGVTVKKSEFNWTISIESGKYPSDDVKWAIINPTTGAVKIEGNVTENITGKFYYYDNNNNGYLDASDAILITGRDNSGNPTGIESGDIFELIKGDAIVTRQILP